MIKQIKTTWRPLIELTEMRYDDQTATATETGGKFHMNVLNVPHIISYPDFTALVYEHFTILVKESAKDIYKVIDKMVEDEQKRKAEEAHKYYEATQQRVANTANVIQMPANDGGESA